MTSVVDSGPPVRLERRIRPRTDFSQEAA